MKKNIFIKIIIIEFLTMFCLSSYIIVKNLLEYKENNQDIEQLIEDVVVKTSTEEINSKEVKSINWEYLKSINEDIIAWIEIENTNINYPILMDNNLYYLNHSYNKQYNRNGSIFTTNTYPFTDEETIIYGHNMRNGSMFSELSKYLNKDFFYSHNIIKIYTPNGNYKGNIISAYSIGIETESNNIKSLDFTEKIKYYKKSSKYNTSFDDNIEKIIKLSTCSYINAKTSPTDQRYYIIVALSPAM